MKAMWIKTLCVGLLLGLAGCVARSGDHSPRGEIDVGEVRALSARVEALEAEVVRLNREVAAAQTASPDATLPQEAPEPAATMPATMPADATTLPARNPSP